MIGLTTIALIVVATIGVYVALFHLMVAIRRPFDYTSLTFSLMSILVAPYAFLAIRVYGAESVESYISALKLQLVIPPIFFCCLMWFVASYTGIKPRRLLHSVSIAFILAIIVHLTLPFGILFSDVTGLARLSLPWGEQITLPVTTPNRWRIVTDIPFLFVLGFCFHSGYRQYIRGEGRPAIALLASLTIFLGTVVFDKLRDITGLNFMYLGEFGFLAIVLVMSFFMSRKIIRAGIISSELVKSERRWRLLLEKVELTIIELDFDGRVKYANPYYLGLSGFIADQVLEKPWVDFLAPSERENAHKIQGANAPSHHLCRILTKDRGERSISWSNVFLFDRNENVIGLLSVGADVTDREKAEEQLEKAYEEVKALKDRLQEENIYLQEEIVLDHNYREIIGESEALKYALNRVQQVASSDTTVLIEGETGVGKELFARAIHDSSPRKDRPLVKVNCAAIPIHLMESELFGHEKGAFTGANRLRKGRFELADEGTIFLDEIGELPLEVQPKLLRVLQDGEFERVGGDSTIQVNVRIIAATNRVLNDEIAAGRFRPDLYYRLSVFPISIPPLRKRKADIPHLTKAFVDKYSKKHGKATPRIPEKTIETLKSYSWPGNVRELQNIIERTIITSSGDVFYMAEGPGIVSSDSSVQSFRGRTLDEMERMYILEVLDNCNWKISGENSASEILGLHPNTLRSRMQKLGINRTQELASK